MTAARGWVIARPRARSAAYQLGLAALPGLALFLALEGLWLAVAVAAVLSAALLWLAGMWALPGTEDAYVLAVGRAWARWGQASQAARTEAHAVKPLSPAPPAGWEGEHERLREIRRTLGRLYAAGNPAPVAGIALEAASLLQEHDAIAAALQARAGTDAERAYAAALGESRAESAARHAAGLQATREADEAMIQQLDGLRAPEPLEASHAAVIAAFRATMHAERALSDALTARDADRAVAAGRQVDAARAELAAAAAPLGERFGWDLERRAPAPAAE